jgi:fibronectin type 3 domain-containing protein
VVFAVAAGNNNGDAGSYSPSNCGNAITVAAIADYNGQPGGGAGVQSGCSSSGSDDSLASFSNYGSVVDIAAPGVCIYSTYPGNSMVYASGTSMASPYVAAAAALDILANGKPQTLNDVLAVRNRLVNSGFAQSSACGYTTRNGLTVPLLNMGTACGGSPPPADTTPPNAPSGLSAVDHPSDNGGAIDLSWTPSTSGDVTQQRIYRNGSLVTTLNSNSTNSYTDTGRTNGVTYNYQIGAWDGTFETKSSPAVPGIAADNTPPPSLTGLTATGGNNQVVLDWPNSAAADVIGYNVYRSTTNGGPYAQINGALVGTSAYTDTTAVNGTPYYYVVTAFDGTYQSGYSNQATATPAAPPPNTAPASPTGLVATAGNGQVALNWNDNGEGDLAGYNVYRSTTNGGPYTKVNGSLLTSSAYTNTSLSNGTTYYYVVTAVDTGNLESGNSAQVFATPTAPATCTWWQRLFGQC